MVSSELSFPVITLQITAVLQGNFALPDYAGSMLRGIYGHALRRISCMTGQRRCEKCPLVSTCPFPELFDPAINKTHRGRAITSAPAPYVIQAPAWGAREIEKVGELVFNIRLFGKATQRMPFVVQAWRQALGRGMGRGNKRASAIISRIDCLETGQKVFDGATGQILPHDIPASVVKSPEQPSYAFLTFETPYRSQQQGHPLSPEKITPRRLIMDIIRRIRLLNDFYGNGLNDENWPVDLWLDMADHIIDDKQLHWQDWRRYSNRQRKAMSLGGVMGQWTWHDTPPELGQILNIGSLLHVGKQTVFGFGRMNCSLTS